MLPSEDFPHHVNMSAAKMAETVEEDRIIEHCVDKLSMCVGNEGLGPIAWPSWYVKPLSMALMYFRTAGAENSCTYVTFSPGDANQSQVLAQGQRSLAQRRSPRSCNDRGEAGSQGAQKGFYEAARGRDARGRLSPSEKYKKKTIANHSQELIREKYGPQQQPSCTTVTSEESEDVSDEESESSLEPDFDYSAFVRRQAVSNAKWEAF